MDELWFAGDNKICVILDNIIAEDLWVEIWDSVFMQIIRSNASAIRDFATTDNQTRNGI
jgi:hypothetical protein